MAKQILIAVAAIVFVTTFNSSVLADPVHITIRHKKPKKPKPPPKPKHPKHGAAGAANAVATSPTLIAPTMSPTGGATSDAGLTSVATDNITTVQGSPATNFGAGNQTAASTPAATTTASTTASTAIGAGTIATGNTPISSQQAALLFSGLITQTPLMGGISTATQPVANGISYFIGGANPGIVTVPGNTVSTSNLPIDYGQANSPGLIPNNLAPNIPHSPSQQTVISSTPQIGGGTSVSVIGNPGVIGIPHPNLGANQTVNTGVGIVTFPSTNLTNTTVTQLTTTTNNTATNTTTGSTTGMTGSAGNGNNTTGSATINLPQTALTTNNPTSVNGNIAGVPAGTTVVANTTGVTGTTTNVLGVSGSASSNTVGAFPVNIGAPLATGNVASSTTGNLGGVFSDGIGAQNLQGGIAPNLGTLGESPSVGGFTTGIGSSNLSGGGAGTVGGPSSGSNL